MLAAASCGYGSQAEDAGRPAVLATGAKIGGVDQVRIGYFPNITHATALVGLQQGFFQKELGGTKIRTQAFDAGPPRSRR